MLYSSLSPRTYTTSSHTELRQTVGWIGNTPYTLIKDWFGLSPVTTYHLQRHSSLSSYRFRRDLTHILYKLSYKIKQSDSYKWKFYY